MANPADIHQAIVEWADSGRAFALALVLETQGSTPRKAGAKAIIDAEGRILGTIGGGVVEAQAQRLAREAIRDGHAIIFEAKLEGDNALQGEPICGGWMRVLIDPTAARHRLAYAAAVQCLRRREQGVLLTTLRRVDKPETETQFVSASEIAGGTELGDADFREPVLPPPLLLLIGGGHVGQAVAAQASLVGFEIVVIDDRPEFTAPLLFPLGVATRCGKVSNELTAFPINENTFILIATRGHPHDAAALAACVRRPAAYIGMIGSRRKVALMRQKFLAAGLATAAEFDRVHAPIGLDIGAETVPEIAASIVAELIAVRRRAI